MSKKSSGEKTEKPTPKRLRDLRKKGQVAKSKEIVSASVILGLFCIFWLLKDYFFSHMQKLIMLPTMYMQLPFKVALGNVTRGVFMEFVYLSAPFIIGAIAFAVLSNIIQFGVLFAIHPLKPDINKLNPVEGFKKIFNINNLIELIKSVVKITFLATLIYLVIKSSLPTLVHIPYLGVNGILAALGMTLKKTVAYTALAFISVAIFDYFFQKYYFIRKNRMTKDEVKRDYKEMEGDPTIKSRRKRLHRELATSDMIQGAKKSTVVITNPTHVAIGIYYAKNETPLPVVKVKGADNLARIIIEAAKEAGVPVAQDIKLARRLYKEAQIDQYVPSDLLKPVAAVLSWVYQLEDQKD